MIARVANFEGVDVREAKRTMGEAEAIIVRLSKASPATKGISSWRKPTAACCRSRSSIRMSMRELPSRRSTRRCPAGWATFSKTGADAERRLTTSASFPSRG